MERGGRGIQIEIDRGRKDGDGRVPEDVPATVDARDGRGEAILGERAAVGGTDGGSAVGGLPSLLDLYKVLHLSAATDGSPRPSSLQPYL